ncbi:MAG: YcaO-like family protein [Kineosporiaceae bacterium]
MSDVRPSGPDIRPRVLVDTIGVGGDEHPVARAVAALLQSHVVVLTGTPPGPGGSGSGAAGPAPDLVVSCAGWLPDARWCDLDAALDDTGIAWHRCHVDGDAIRLGPLAVPGHTARYADSRARRLAASTVSGELEALWRHLDSGTAVPPIVWPDPGTVAVAAAVLVADVLAHLGGRCVPHAHHETVVRGAVVSRHPVLPLPTSPRRPAPGTLPPTALVDPRFGVVTRLRREPEVPGLPRAFVDVTADLARTSVFAPWRADAITGGAALGDVDQARAAALGEAVERYCGNAVPAVMRTASADELTAAGEDAIDPAGLALYSARQYAEPGFPFVPFTRELTTSWVPGGDLEARTRPGDETGRVWVPAALTYLNVNRHLSGPPITGQAFAGIAAGPSIEAAERAALEELVERDAVTIWWASGAEATALDLGGDPGLGPVLDDSAAAGLRTTFLDVPSATGIPVVGAFVVDPVHGVVGFGSACRATRAAAAAKALTEALVVLMTGRELADPDSRFWRGVRDGRTTAEPYRPFRVDRRYRESFRPDLRDLTVLDLAVQLYLDPRLQDASLRRLREPAGTTPPAAPCPPGADPRRWYLDSLADLGLRAVSVDLTTPDVAAAGLHVVRVLVPGLVQNAPAAFPVLGGARLYTEPVARGWVAGPLTEGDLVRDPLPFA